MPKGRKEFMKRKNLILLVLLLAIGFAAVSTTLVLNGTLNIGENTQDFDVYFSKTLEDGVENNKLIKDDTHLEFSKDMSLKGDTYTLEYDVTNGSRNYDAEITINCTESNEYVGVTNEFDTTNNLLATETRRGKLKIEVLKPYVGTTEESTKDISITCEIVGNAVERESLGEGTPADKVKQSPWTITEDNDSNGEVSQGDLITLDTESFYVYDIDGDNVKAISQYNLYVGNSCTSIDSSSCTPLENPTGLQDSRAIGWTRSEPYIGTVAYDSTSPYSSVYETSEIKTYVDAYKTKLEELNGNIKEARLITKEELEALGCNSINSTCRSAPSYIRSTSYWTMSPSVDIDGNAWSVNSFGNFRYDIVRDDRYCGVRPVIIISKSLI